MIRTTLTLAAIGATISTAQAGLYSSYSGVTTGAPDNPIARASITKFESSIVNYSPAPGVGSNFNSSLTGVRSLGDLYSPVASPSGTNSPFNKAYAPQTGSEPSSFHAGSGVNSPFGGDINNTTDTYGFIGIDAPGSITLGFSKPITNGAGADFAVFENGFAFGGATSLFAELAFVEVSSNGVDFLRFPSISLNTSSTAVSGTFQGYDVTNLYNLAGKHASNWGTPFDLAELATNPQVTSGIVDITAISYVRLVDVVGSGELSDGAGGFLPGVARDSLGNAILDNWVTFDSGGFDYVGLATGAVGVLNSVPEPNAALLVMACVGAAGSLRRR